MPNITVTDMNINNLVLDDQDFDCYIIAKIVFITKIY